MGFFMLSYMSSLYILDINPLLIYHFANIFSHPVGSLLVLLIASFTVQKLFSLRQSHLFFLCFCFPCLRRHIQKNITKTDVKELPAYVFFQKFYGFRSSFKSLIHFELIFVHGVREQSSLILLHVVVQFSQHPLLKRLFFPHCIFLLPL